ncbi:uncharacterized protein LOC141914306 [Tubulanus polymorphus]|uniref:uncharacterized protein LOC141914306 n=1 Tax=Tubulanus polymorphus TaxID=672921 RepID=UPI003DA2B7D8
MKSVTTTHRCRRATTDSSVDNDVDDDVTMERRKFYANLTTTTTTNCVTNIREPVSSARNNREPVSTRFRGLQLLTMNSSMIFITLLLVISATQSQAAYIPTAEGRLDQVSQARISDDLKKLLCYIKDLSEEECAEDSAIQRVLSKLHEEEKQNEDMANYREMLEKRGRQGSSSFYSEWK